MNVFDFWSGRSGTVAFAITNMDWDFFSSEVHSFQCGDFNSDMSLLHPKDFEKAMKEKGYEITVYIPTETVDWWCND